MTCADAARIGHAKRREPILAKARQMLADMGKEPDPRLAPPLILSRADRIG